MLNWGKIKDTASLPEGQESTGAYWDKKKSHIAQD